MEVAAEDSGRPLYLSDFLARALEERPELNDVCFTFPDKSQVMANKTILACASDVFAHLLFPEGKASSSSSSSSSATDPLVVAMDESVDSKLFQMLISSMYADELLVDSGDQLTGLIELSERYAVKQVRDMCEEFLDSERTVENCCSLFEMAARLFGKKDHGLEFVCENFRHATQTTGFLQLHRERLRSILESDSVACREMMVWEALVCWAEAQVEAEHKQPTTDAIKEAVGNLWLLIRFPLMTLEELVVVSQTGIIDPALMVMLLRHAGEENPEVKKTVATNLPFSLKTRKGSGN